jgi:hypothetical protein
MSAMNWEIQFTNVGRGKRCWTQLLTQLPTEAVIARLAKAALASRGVDVLFDEQDANTGTIFVGGCRPVGEFTIKQLEAP